jgi:replicative DNA helicase
MARTSKNTTTTPSTKTKKLTPFEQETIEVLKLIKEYKLAAEANVVSIIYKEPDVLRETNLTIDEFHDNAWRVFFAIASDLILIEKKNQLDVITFNLYLEKHKKLAAKADEYGGYDAIDSSRAYVKTENFDGYVRDLRKFNALMKLAKLGFPIPKDRLSDFNDMTAEEIYDEYNAYLNDTFVNLDNDVKSYNGFDGLYELIEDADRGDNVGLPLYNAHLLTKEIGGINLNGHIYGIGASSGTGKSTMAINYLFPSIVEYDERAVFIINEEDQSKFRREALIWVSTNILKRPVPKYKFRDGKFDEETKKTLYEAAAWLEEKKEKRNITIIPLERYSAKIACKIIKKYASLGVRLFVVDTLKESYDIGNEATWKGLERDMVALYDTIKPSACNVGLVVTYQLSKGSMKTRHLTNSDIGQGRSIVDTMSCNLLMRKPFDDEYTGENNALNAYRLDGKNCKTKIPIKLDKDKHYMLTFIGKNRFGSTDEFTIVSECDLSINEYCDIGYCIVPGEYT